MANKDIEYGWAIWNPRVGFYFTTFTDTRSCAISDHVKIGETWKDCRKRGDRPVKAKLVKCEWKSRSRGQEPCRRCGLNYAGIDNFCPECGRDLRDEHLK